MYLDINDEQFELKLTTKKLIALEDKLGKNPLSIFMEDTPKINDIYELFKACVITECDTEELFDKVVYVKGFGGLISEVIIPVMQESGYLNIETKNAQKRK